MTVRAKFKVDSIERSKQQFWSGNTSETKEVQTIKLSAVYGAGSEENKKFWAATPSGQVSLSTINAEAGNYFELGQEYYIDFIRAG